jgi:CheY-like chemotaxis protein
MATAIHSRTKPLIYIVDDEEMILELAAVLLAPLGYEIATFRDPAQALAAFAAAAPRPALVLTDYAMPTMDGMEFLTQCRRLVPQQKVVLISGTVSEAIYAQSPVRPDRFLAKPFSTGQLVEVIKEMVGE